MSPAKWAAAAVVALGALFALQGGEYSSWDLVRIRSQEREERERVEQLERIVDSLELAARAIERDPRVQERVAREQFGMLRRGEYLYKLVPAGEPQNEP